MAKTSSRKSKSASSYTSKDRELIITELLALKKELIRDFLARHELATSGTKEEIRERVEQSLKNRKLSVLQIVQFLDEIIPWGKQHVYLYEGPKSSIADWRNTDWLADRLKQHNFEKYLNAQLPLVMPTQMEITSIHHDPGLLRVTAIKKRVSKERDPSFDEDRESGDGDEIELHAYVRRHTRSLVAFEWNLVANTAMLQISQLPSRVDYEDVAKEFFSMIAKWLDINLFSMVDLRPVIKRLHELEEAKAGHTRSHGINYRTKGGRRLEGKSQSASDPLVGEPVVDAALGAVRTDAVGHMGNFYWLPGSDEAVVNPLGDELHFIVVGPSSRINFPTPNNEQDIRYVLSRIRSHCTEAVRLAERSRAG